MYDAPKEQTNDEPYWSPSAEEFSGHSSDDDVQPAANTHLHFRDFSMSPTPATCDPQNPPTPVPTTPTVNRSQIYTPTPPGSPNLFEFCDDGERKYRRSNTLEPYLLTKFFFTPFQHSRLKNTNRHRGKMVVNYNIQRRRWS